VVLVDETWRQDRDHENRGGARKTPPNSQVSSRKGDGWEELGVSHREECSSGIVCKEFLQGAWRCECRGCWAPELRILLPESE
jgi:hypothetical protein